MSQLKGTYKEIIVITLPLLLGNASHTLIALTDTMFMSRLNEDALASVGYISMFYMLLVVLGYSYTKSVQIQVAKRMGEQQEHKIGNIIDSALIIMFFAALILFSILYFFPTYFLKIFIDSPEIISTGKIFLHYRVPGIFFNYFGCVLIAYYTGIGKTIIPGISMVCMLLFNILFNYLLVFGHWGFPQMGVAGSGLASTLAELISVLVLLIGIFFFGGIEKHQLLKFVKFDRQEVKELNHLGLPIVGQTAIGFVSWIYFFSCIENIMGKESLAVSNILRPVYQIFSVPAWSLANSVNTLVGNIRGQGLSDEIGKVAKRGMVVSVIVTLFTILILLPFPCFWITLISGQSSYVDQCIGPLWMICVSMLVFAVAIIIFNVIVSIGSTRISLTIEITSIFLYLVYTYSVFHFMKPTLTFAWSTEIVYWVLIGIFSYYYLKKFDWKKKIRNT